MVGGLFLSGWLGFVVGATTAPEADWQPPVRLDLVQEIEDGVDGVSITNHVGTTTARGDYVYASIQYTGQIKCFKRDAKTSRLTFVADVPWGGKNDSVGAMVWAGGRLYFNGGGGHWSADGDSRGLHWFDVDPATGPSAGSGPPRAQSRGGALTEKGKLDTPISAGLVVGADQKDLYLLLAARRAVVHYLSLPKTPSTLVFKELRQLWSPS